MTRMIETVRTAKAHGTRLLETADRDALCGTHVVRGITRNARSMMAMISPVRELPCAVRMDV